MTRKGHLTATGVKNRYADEAAANAALQRRQADVVNHEGKPWRLVGTYPCGWCSGWHLTSKSTLVHPSPNFMGGGWARDYLLENIEMGARVASWLKRENFPSSHARGIIERFKSAERHRLKAS